MLNPLCLPDQVHDVATSLRSRLSRATGAAPAAPAQPTDAWRGVSQAPSIETAIDQATGTRAVPGNQVDLLVKDEYLPALWDSLRGAQHSVMVSALKIDDSPYGTQTAEILAERARAGVQVRVLLDTFNSRGGIGDKAVATMRAAGVQVHYLNRPVGRTVEEIQHRKLTVIDGETAFVGGQNLDWAGHNAHDATMRVRGPILTDLHNLALQNWRDCDGPAMPDPPTPHPAPVGNTVLRPLVTDPCHHDFKEALLTAIDHAQHHIYLDQVFFSDREVIDHLGRAAQRGVTVNLIIPQKSYSDEINAVNRVDLPGLLQKGIRVYINPQETHMKAVTIDGTWGVHGSTNLDARALNDNYELSLALSNPEAVRTFDTRIMIPTLLQSHQAGPGSLAQPNQTLLARLKDRGMSLVRRFL